MFRGDPFITAGVFKKKPVEIDAVYYSGANRRQLEWWSKGTIVPTEVDGQLRVLTLEGDHLIAPNYWVIKGVQGEFYGCDPAVFEATYDLVQRVH